MVTVIGMWESEWMDWERTERRIWKQTIQAFEVDHWVMVPGETGKFTSPEMYDDMKTALAACPGKKTFLVAPKSYPDAKPLHLYKHPKDAIYVFGNSVEHLLGFVTDKDDIIGLHTPVPSGMFGHTVLCSVLYDRMIGRNQ